MSYGMQQAPQYGGGNGYGYPPPNNANQGGQAQGYYNEASGPGGYGKQQQYGSGPMPLAPEGYQGQRFAPAKPKIRDPIFLVLFLAVFGGFIGLGVYVLRDYSISDVSGGIGGNTGGLSGTLNQHTAIMLTLACAVALVFSAVYLAIVRIFTRIILEITLVLSVLANIAYAVYLWVEQQIAGAIILTIFAVISIIAYPFMRRKIPLARLLLRTIINATKQHPSVYLWALGGLIVQTFFSIFTAWIMIATYQRFSPSGAAAGRGGNTSSGAVTGLVVFIVFAYYWISETLKGLFFVTNAGTFGTWYYAAPGESTRGASLKSFGRASTFSLGSIAFGSLILAILDLLRGILSVVQQTEAQSGDMLGAAIACVVQCLLGCIQWAIEFINKYALVNLALYGNSYITAAKETWHLLKDRGIDALVNDSLVNIVFTFGSWFVAVITGIFAYVYMKQTDPSYLDSTSSYYSVILFAALGLGFQICATLGAGTIGAGVTTLFVALAEDPQVFAQKEPELFEHIRQAYPRVIQPV